MSSVWTDVIVEKTYTSTEKYVVFAARTGDGQHVRVRSTKLIDPAPGEMYRVLGSDEVYTDSRGIKWRQIATNDLRRVGMSGALIGPWLQRLPHLGEIRSRRLIDAFGVNLGNVLNDPGNLSKVAAALDPSKPLLAQRIAAKIYADLASKKAFNPMAEEEFGFFAKLENMGVTDTAAARSLWRLVGGADAIERLMRNPYLASALMSWSRADHLGKALLLQCSEDTRFEHHPARLLGAVISAWRDLIAEGHTAATPANFQATLLRKGVDVEQSISLAIDKRHIIITDGLYRAPGAAWIEESLAERLRALENAKGNVVDIEKICGLVRQAEILTGLSLHADQRAAVQVLLTLRLGVLQGGAGVGKTTVMKVLVCAWELMGGTILMGALAGKASLQLSRGTSTNDKPRQAYTIARILRTLEKNRGQQQNMDLFGGHSGDEIVLSERTLFIIDEASMVDTGSLQKVSEHLPLGSAILLVGDCGQLPPVGMGRVFHDLVEDGSRVVTLSKVLRQSDDSPVPAAATAIRAGNLPRIPQWSVQETGIFVVYDESKLYDVYIEALSKSSDVMLVAAKKNTVDRFNKKASEHLRILRGSDTQQQALRLGPLTSVAERDPVVCTRNHYKLGLFNGLLGIVIKADADEGVVILWDGSDSPMSLPRELYNDIELAYAITCHRAQGSAAKYVIVYVEDSPLVTREWLYTAVTRTRDTVILVGSPNAMQKAVARRSDRVTGFALKTN